MCQFLFLFFHFVMKLLTILSKNYFILRIFYICSQHFTFNDIFMYFLRLTRLDFTQIFVINNFMKSAPSQCKYYRIITSSTTTEFLRILCFKILCFVCSIILTEARKEDNRKKRIKFFRSHVVHGPLFDFRLSFVAHHTKRQAKKLAYRKNSYFHNVIVNGISKVRI